MHVDQFVGCTLGHVQKSDSHTGLSYLKEQTVHNIILHNITES